MKVPKKQSNMRIRDKVILGMLAGSIGSIAKTAVDKVSIRQKDFATVFRKTAAKC